jgi:predicted enzyme related to lactoylglutathione lyase
MGVFWDHRPSICQTVFYYLDLQNAIDFYAHAIGLEQTGREPHAAEFRISNTSFLRLMDARQAENPDAPKTTAIALVSRELESWYTFATRAGLPLRDAFSPRPKQPHDGFVVVDPEGYFLEFERFNPHRENKDLLPLLADAATLRTANGLGFQASITWLYYDDLESARRFYEQQVGLEIVVDQGWARIYPTSTTGFLGLVDGARGMHQATAEQAVQLEFRLEGCREWAGQARTLGWEGLNEVPGENGAGGVFVGRDTGGYELVFRPA